VHLKKNLWGHQAPRFLSPLVVIAIVADVAVLLVRGKQHFFAFSKSWPEYFIWLEGELSEWTGRCFLVGVLLYVIFRLIRGKLIPADLEPSKALVHALNQAGHYLRKSVLAFPVLAVSLVACPLIFVLLPRNTPPPPPGGKCVLSGSADNPTTSLLYRIINTDKYHFVAGYSLSNYDSSIPYPPAIYFTPSQAAALETVAVTADGKTVFVTDSTAAKVWVFDAGRSGPEMASLPVDRTANAIALSADGRKLYVGIVGPIPEGRIDVFDTASRSHLNTIKGVGCPMEFFAPARAPLLFVVTQCGAGQDPFYVIDTRTDQAVKGLSGFAVGRHIASTSDGRTVFVAVDDRFAIVGNYMSDSPEVRWLPGSVTAMAVSPDDHTLFVGMAVNAAPIGGNEAALNVGPYGTFRASTDQSTELPKAALFGVNVLTGKPCRPEPAWLESQPPAIAIAPSGGLYAPLPNRLFVTDYRAIACS